MSKTPEDKAKTREGKPAGQWTIGQLLDSVPQRNQAVKTQRMADGDLRIAVPLQQKARIPIIMSKPRASHYRKRLDPIGAIVWEMIDGHSTMEQIIDRFSREYRLSFHEARVAVAKFVTALTRMGAARVEPPKQDVDE